MYQRWAITKLWGGKKENVEGRGVAIEKCRGKGGGNSNRPKKGVAIENMHRNVGWHLELMTTLGGGIFRCGWQFMVIQ